MTVADPLLWHASGTAHRDRPPPCKERIITQRGREVFPFTVSEFLSARAGDSS